MKKITSIIMTMGLVLMMSFQALAAPSIVAHLGHPTVHSQRGEASINPVGPGTYSEPLQSQVDGLNDAAANANVADAFGDNLSSVRPVPLYDPTAKNIVEQDTDLSKYHFLTPVMDLKVDGDMSAANPGDVTFDLQNLTDNMDVYILCYCAEDGKWEVIPASKVEGKKATFYVHGNGPVSVIYKLKNADQPGGQSPQTGEANVAGALGVIAVLFAMFGVYALKRSRKEV